MSANVTSGSAPNSQASWQLTLDAGGGVETDRWRRLPPPAIVGLDAPEAYIPEQATVDAVNVALALGQPLLVTGEPGCGKTALAFWVAHRLGLGRPLCFQTRSTAAARDLFYVFDALGRFSAAQNRDGRDDRRRTRGAAMRLPHPIGRTVDPRAYITYTGLGEAIMRALGRERVTQLVASNRLEHYPTEALRSVLLIDEIDKAPRDFPNDVLGEIANFAFTIPELGGIEIAAPKELLPIVIVTSNMERALPDAFLRRCVYHNMPFPEPKKLEQIIHARIKAIPAASPLAQSAVEIVSILRSAGLTKPPGTAEMLAFVLALRARGIGPDHRLRNHAGWIGTAMSTLVKIRTDDNAAKVALSAMSTNVK
jgi:MoxR-like ATPase